MTISDQIFDGERIKGRLEANLWDAGVQFEDASYDYYDNSIELFDVPNDYRLSVESQEIIYNAGFSIIYLNHKDKWETHYNFYKLPPGSFREVEGWRVSYPQKRGKGHTGIWVEQIVEQWPKEWFKDGYAMVVTDEYIKHAWMCNPLLNLVLWIGFYAIYFCLIFFNVA